MLLASCSARLRCYCTNGRDWCCECASSCVISARRLYRLGQTCTNKNEKKIAYVKHPNESQAPTVCLDEGPAGGFWPLQKTLRRFDPPQASVVIPVQPMLQSDANSFVPVGAMAFAQSYITLESIPSNFTIRSCYLQHSWEYSVPA